MPLGVLRSSFPAFLKEDVMLKSEHINFCVTIPANTTTWTIVGDALNTFDYDYFLEKVVFISETNALVRAILKFNDELFPSRNFVITSSENKENNDPASNSDEKKAYYIQNGYFTEYLFNLILENSWTFQVYNINTHTSDQKVWIILTGYRIYRKKENLQDYMKKNKLGD